MGKNNISVFICTINKKSIKGNILMTKVKKIIGAILVIVILVIAKV